MLPELPFECFFGLGYQQQYLEILITYLLHLNRIFNVNFTVMLVIFFFDETIGYLKRHLFCIM